MGACSSLLLLFKVERKRFSLAFLYKLSIIPISLHCAQYIWLCKFIICIAKPSCYYLKWSDYANDSIFCFSINMNKACRL